MSSSFLQNIQRIKQGEQQRFAQETNNLNNETRYKISAIENQTKAFQNLSATLGKIYETKLAEEKQQAINDADYDYFFGENANPQLSTGYDQAVAEISAGHNASLGVADQALQGGASFEAADEVKQSSGWYQWRMNQNRLNSQLDLVAPMLQKLAADNETQLEAGGMTFTPAEAIQSNNIAQIKAFHQWSKRKVYGDLGFNAYNRDFFMKHGFKKMTTAFSSQWKTLSTNQANSVSALRQQDALESFIVNKNILQLHKEFATTQKDGKVLGNAGAWDEIEKILPDLVKAGRFTMADLKEVEATIDPETNKPVGKRWETRFGLIRAAIRDEENKAFTALTKQRKNGATAAAIEFIENNPDATTEEIQQAQRQIFSQFKVKSTELDNMLAHFSMDATAKAENKEYIDMLISKNAATVQDVITAPGLTAQEKLNRVQLLKQLEEFNAANGGLTGAKQEIKNMMNDQAKWSIASGLSNVKGSGRVQQELQEYQQRRFRERIASIDPSDKDALKSAYDASVEDTRAYYNSKVKDPTSRLYFDPAKSGFTRAFIGDEGAAPLDNQDDFVKTYDNLLKSKKTHSQILSDPESLASLGVTEQVVTDNGNNFNRPNWQPVPQASFLGRQFPNTNAIEVENMMRAAYGLSPLGEPGSLVVVKSASPETQALARMYGDGAPMIRNRQLVEAWSAGEDIIPFVVPDGAVISEQAEETRPFLATLHDLAPGSVPDYSAIAEQLTGKSFNEKVDYFTSNLGVDRKSFLAMAAKYGSPEALNSPELKRPGIQAALSQIPSGDKSFTGALTYENNERSYVEVAEAFKTEGFTVSEHALYGGVAPVHAGNSYHKYNEAFDVIINREKQGFNREQDIAKIRELKEVVRSLNLFIEVIGPGDGDPNHEAHLHVGGLLRPITPADIKKINSVIP